MRSSTSRKLLIALSTVACSALAFGASSASATPTCGTTGVGNAGSGSCLYTTAASDTFTVPAYRDSVTFTLYGAGDFRAFGGMSRGTLSTHPGKVFEINVGGRADGQRGGFNGGGGAGGGGDSTAGGGASDVRNGGHGLTDRLLVAGGAGGSAPFGSGDGADGGSGGGLAGLDGASRAGDGGGAGNQQGGGRSPGNADSAGRGFGGKGGTGARGTSFVGGAGGGGGYFGGGGSGAASLAGGGPGGGGGGSGFITSEANKPASQTGGSKALLSTPGRIYDGTGEVLVSWPALKTATVKIDSNPASPVRDDEKLKLTTTVDLGVDLYPEGEVTVTDNGKRLGQEGLHSGNNFKAQYVITLAPGELSRGDHEIVATYRDSQHAVPDATGSLKLRRQADPPQVRKDPEDTTIKYGSSASFKAEAAGPAASTTTQWQESVDRGKSFQTIDNGRDQPDKLEVLPRDRDRFTQEAVRRYDGRLYRAQFTGEQGGVVRTKPAKLSVEKARLKIQAPDAEKAFGTRAAAFVPTLKGVVQIGGITDSPVVPASCGSDGADFASGVGRYAIVCKDYRDTPNYTVEDLEGTLKVLLICESSTATATEGSSAPFTAACGPTDVRKSPLVFEFDNPAHGSLSNIQKGTGTGTYTPAAGFRGADAFRFRVRGPDGVFSAWKAITVLVGSATKNLTVTKVSLGGGLGTVQSSPAGIMCGALCSAPFLTGSQVTLTATHNPGSFFLGWSGGACNGLADPICVATIGADTTVTATFGGP